MILCILKLFLLLLFYVNQYSKVNIFHENHPAFFYPTRLVYINGFTHPSTHDT